MSSHYSAEFKQKAVEIVTTQRKSITPVSFEFNVSKAAMDPAQEIKRLSAQNEAMKKEVTQLRAERDDAKEESRWFFWVTEEATLSQRYLLKRQLMTPSSIRIWGLFSNQSTIEMQ